jgi:hypothetical protein
MNHGAITSVSPTATFLAKFAFVACVDPNTTDAQQRGAVFQG